MDKSAKQKFFQSCLTGDLNNIKKDLFYNMSPFCQDKYGNNALHLSCINNQPKVLEYLLKNVKAYKCDVQNKLGRTALNIAASQGAFECIDILLDNLKCDINSTDKNFKNTPLHWCVISRCIKGVEKLLNYQADYTLINKSGQTPLELAKATCSDVFNLIDKFIKNKDQHISHQNCSMETKSNKNKELSSNSIEFKLTDESTKVFKDTMSQQNANGETILEPDLTSNNANDFFLDISKLKHGDNSVLNLLEKSIEPVDDTSFVSSILNSGKVIQLTEAGILALEYTKNEINTPIPDRLVKSFLTTTQQYNDTENHVDNDDLEKDIEFDPKVLLKGLKRLNSPKPCSKRFKYTETTSNKNNEFDGLLEQLSTKTLPKVYNSTSYSLQNSVSVENSTVKNNEVCSKNQLMCLNPDLNAQPKWVEEFMCLLHKVDNSDIEHK